MTGLRRRALAHREPPRSADLRHPPRYLLHPLRPAARAVVRTRLDVRLHGAENVPAGGPVILASNHIGAVDGPVLAIFSPRPVHALTKQEMFAGAAGPFLHASGQIRLDRFHPDPGAVKACLGVLRDGGVVGIFPEGTRGAGDLQRFKHGAAYLALVTGAPVVPVTILGTRAPGEDKYATPPRHAVVDLVYGPAWQVPAARWPRRKEQVAVASAALQAHMQAALAAALASTGRELPGPLPPGTPGADEPPDPARGAA